VLTDADLAIGDGDHGTGMRRGFEAAHAALGANPPATIEDAFKAVGMAVISETGGAAGAIFGTLFRSGGKGPCRQGRARRRGLRDIPRKRAEAVLKRGGVTEGQKTIIDALAPGRRARRRADRWPTSRLRAAQGALDGVEATKGHDRHDRQGPFARRTQPRSSRSRRDLRLAHPRAMMQALATIEALIASTLAAEAPLGSNSDASQASAMALASSGPMTRAPMVMIWALFESRGRRPNRCHGSARRGCPAPCWPRCRRRCRCRSTGWRGHSFPSFTLATPAERSA
jgi:hypothetical protein